MLSAVLYDIDSRIPNLALMKLGAYYRKLGYQVLLTNACSYLKADLDAVIRLTFRSNGQNWEKYLRWVSRLYFQTFGRFYLPLLKIIYRYNRRENIHKFLDQPDLLTSELFRSCETLPEPDLRIAQLARGTAKSPRRVAGK